MLMLALGVFTLVAVMGLLMALDVFKSVGTSRCYALTHAGLAGFGSVLVILAAVGGDGRLWVNIGLAVGVIGLGAYLGLQRAQGKHPKGLVMIHGSGAVACYALLAYNTFSPAV